MASPASSKDPRGASTAANRCSPAECLPTGRLSTASAGCRFRAGPGAGACGIGVGVIDASGALPPDVLVVVPVPSGIGFDAGSGTAPEAVGPAGSPSPAADVVPGTAR